MLSKLSEQQGQKKKPKKKKHMDPETVSTAFLFQITSTDNVIMYKHLSTTPERKRERERERARDH